MGGRHEWSGKVSQRWYVSGLLIEEKEAVMQMHKEKAFHVENSNWEVPEVGTSLVPLREEFQMHGKWGARASPRCTGVSGRVKEKGWWHLRVAQAQHRLSWASLGTWAHAQHCVWEPASWLTKAFGRQMTAPLRTAYFGPETGPGTNSFRFALRDELENLQMNRMYSSSIYLLRARNNLQSNGRQLCPWGSSCPTTSEALKGIKETIFLPVSSAGQGKEKWRPTVRVWSWGLAYANLRAWKGLDAGAARWPRPSQHSSPASSLELTAHTSHPVVIFPLLLYIKSCQFRQQASYAPPSSQMAPNSICEGRCRSSLWPSLNRSHFTANSLRCICLLYLKVSTLNVCQCGPFQSLTPRRYTVYYTHSFQRWLQTLWNAFFVMVVETRGTFWFLPKGRFGSCLSSFQTTLLSCAAYRPIFCSYRLHSTSSHEASACAFTAAVCLLPDNFQSGI